MANEKQTRPSGRSFKDVVLAFGPAIIILLIASVVASIYIDPAPPKHFVITTGGKGDDSQTFAEAYRDILKEDGVTLEIRPSKGNWENLSRLKDPKSDVEAGFVEDGLGNAEEAPEVSSLGSLYYEPLWVFYSGKTPVTRFSQLTGKRIGVGETGGGLHTLAMRLLKASGVAADSAKFVEVGNQDAVDALKKHEVDAAFFLATPDEAMIKNLSGDKDLHLMSVDQAEAIARQFPYLHHLILPHGGLDLKKNIPEHDVDIISPTATLLVRDSLHPAMIYLLLKAASQIHSDPGIFEKKNEFPIDKDYQFPLADEAKTYYKTGAPFWQRYLPFWLATLVDRFILLVIPLLALIVPIVKLVPRILEWRVKSRIYQRYGELKFLETQIKPELGQNRYVNELKQLDQIEERVNQMKVPVDFSDYFYVLREHIHFVRERLQRLLNDASKG